jgi:protein phosphatase
MGTTLTVATMTGNILYLLHVGDSRAYLIRDGRASLLTRDHTVVGDMVRSRIITPDKMRTHHQRSVLTRAVGLGLFVQPDIDQVPLKRGDRIVICSDGLWSVVEDDEFAALSLQSRNVSELTESLINLALERDTDDNCSAVSIQVQSFGSVHDQSAPGGWRSWLGFSKK